MSNFDKKVYRELLKIPMGKVVSYKQLCKRLGIYKKGMERRVALSLKRNPLFLLLPCHRVIKNDGDIGGYNLGKHLKRRLLTLERKIAELLKDDRGGKDEH